MFPSLRTSTWYGGGQESPDSRLELLGTLLSISSPWEAIEKRTGCGGIPFYARALKVHTEHNDQRPGEV